jgi:hypothetical protein
MSDGLPGFPWSLNSGDEMLNVPMGQGDAGAALDLFRGNIVASMLGATELRIWIGKQEGHQRGSIYDSAGCTFV